MNDADCIVSLRCPYSLLMINIDSRMSIVRGERGRGYLELPKSMEYTYGDSVEHIIKCLV